MRQYTIVHPLSMSFYSRSLYRDVGRNWKGIGLAYLLFLLALFWIPEMIKTHINISEFLAAEAPKMISQVPTITISKGEVSIDKPAPHFIYAPGEHEPFVIIDTSGRFTSLEGTKAVALLTRTKLIVKRYPSETRMLDLSPIGNMVIDQKTVSGWVEIVRGWSVFVLYPFSLLFSFFYYIVQIFACAMIGTFFSRRFQAGLGYRTLTRLAAVSFTPALILQSAHSLLDIEFPLASPVSFLIATGYLYYAVGVNSEKEEN